VANVAKFDWSKKLLKTLKKACRWKGMMCILLQKGLSEAK
jgi:hypothetical protein